MEKCPVFHSLGKGTGKIAQIHNFATGCSSIRCSSETQKGGGGGGRVGGGLKVSNL